MARALWGDPGSTQSASCLAWDSVGSEYGSRGPLWVSGHARMLCVCWRPTPLNLKCPAHTESSISEAVGGESSGGKRVSE